MQVADIQEQIVDMTQEHPEFEGHFVDHSKAAVEARKHIRQLNKSKNQLDKELKVKQQQLEDIEKDIKQIEKCIEEEKGPFLEKFQFQFQKSFFGSQGLVIRNKISHVFHPQDITLENETVCRFGSYMLAQKKRTLMEKFL